MIAFAVLLAIFEVFIISQISFWGAVPLLPALLVYIFRYEARLAELVTAGAVYGFTLSIFSPTTQAMTVYLAPAIASLVSVGLLKIIGESRLRIRMKGYDAVLVGGSFVFVYWLTHSAANIGVASLRSTVIFVLWSMIATLSTMLVVDLIRQRVAVR